MTIRRTIGWLTALAFMLLAAGTEIRAETRTDRTLSPYFLIQSDDPGVDALPLKSTRADITVSGVIADIRVTQEYRNQGSKALEALYVFPASTRAAVYGMKMTVGERIIEATVRRRAEARQAYEQAKQAGRRASLLEQQRPNVFQMNVANILPGDIIRVELKYTELLVPQNGIYELVYPTVTGPRYVNPSAEGRDPGETWTANPYLRREEPPPHGFDIHVTVAAGLPIQEIDCATHKTRIDFRGPSRARIDLDSAETRGGDRDFILTYRLAGGAIDTGLLLYEGEKENYFLLMVQPPRRVEERQIPPREYIFIVDVSGSMNGFPLSVSKRLLKNLIGGLRPTDRFNVLLFAGSSRLLSDRSLPATADNIHRAVSILDRQSGGGGTRLLPALKRAFALPKTEGTSRSVLVITDGYVAVEKDAFHLIRNRLNDANLFPFGIGSSVNRHLIEGMARMGMGEPFIVTRQAEAPGRAAAFRRLIASPVLTRQAVDFNGFEAYSVEPPGIPDVMADRPVILFGKWRGRPRGNIVLKGYSGTQLITKTVDVSVGRPMADNAALRYLWARHRIALLSDFNRLKPEDTTVEEITRLGLTHNLLTAYTSFVAVDHQRGSHDGRPVTIRQPLPLPRGVPESAVGSGYIQRRRTQVRTPPKRIRLRETEVQADRSHGPATLVDGKKRGESTRVGHLAVKDVSVDGHLSKSDVRRIIDPEMADLNRCLDTIQADDSTRKPILTFEVTVDPSGTVIAASRKNGDPEGSRFLSCVIQTLKRLRFQPLGKQQKTVITIRFERT